MVILKKESFLKQLVYVSIGTIITLIIGFFTTPIITKITDPSVYGKFSLFDTVSKIFFMFACLGFDQGYIRYYYIYKDISFKKKLLWFCFFPPVLLCVLLAVLWSSYLEFVYYLCFLLFQKFLYL